jgi:signal transduction histidine kinase
LSAPTAAGRQGASAAKAWVRSHWQRRTHSIKGRLVALFVLLALATTVVFLLGTQQILQSGWVAYVRPLVADYAQRLAADLGSPPDPARARALAQRLPIAVHISGPLVQLDTHPGRFDRRHGADHRPGRSIDNAAGGARDRADRGSGDSASEAGPDRDLRPWSWTVQRADGHRISFALVAPPAAERPRLLGWATLAALLALTALAYAAVRRQLQPIQDISTGVQAFGAGRFDTPIAVRRRDELGELAARINTMAHSLNGMLDAKRALLLAMSHELRSPLTRARVNAELLEDSPERQALLRDLGEMRDQITALLEGERLADGHRSLHTERVDLAALAAEAAAADAERHPQAQAVVMRVAAGDFKVQADATRLRLLLRNLLHNARRHGAAGSSPGGVPAPELFLHREAGGRIALGVRDHGPGVPPAQLPLLAQAFFRPDSARTRSSGGVGLGLYLCRLVAQAHGGELRISNAQPGLQVAMVW